MSSKGQSVFSSENSKNMRMNNAACALDEKLITYLHRFSDDKLAGGEFSNWDSNCYKHCQKDLEKILKIINIISGTVILAPLCFTLLISQERFLDISFLIKFLQCLN